MELRNRGVSFRYDTRGSELFSVHRNETVSVGARLAREGFTSVLGVTQMTPSRASFAPTGLALLADAITLELVFDVHDLGAAVRCGQAVFAQIHEDHLLYGQDAFASDLVAHFAGQRDRGAAELGSGDAQFDDVALARGADEVDFGDVLGHHTLVAQLDNGVDGRLFVDPAQQAAAEQGAVGVEVFGFYPFAGVKVHGGRAPGGVNDR